MIKSIFRVFHNQYRLFSLDQKKPRTFTQVWLEKFIRKSTINPNKKKPKRKKTEKKKRKRRKKRITRI